MSAALADWTAGAEAITFQTLQRLRPIQYFRARSARHAARLIGRRSIASGAGHRLRRVARARAATPETRAQVPYMIVLVDVAEGFRMMAHGDNDLTIGDTVTASFKPFAGKLVPFSRRKRKWIRHSGAVRQASLERVFWAWPARTALCGTVPGEPPGNDENSNANATPTQRP